MNKPNDTPKTRYEKKRKQKLVSFNTENSHDADLLAMLINWMILADGLKNN